MMKLALRVAGIVCTLFFVGFSFSRVNWTGFASALAALKYPWVIAAAIAMLGSMYLRAYRWFVVTGLPREDRSKVWLAACAGYLGIIYPARAGEVLRMMRLNQLTGMGGGLAIGSAVADRILDGLGLGALLLVLIMFSKVASEVPSALVLIVWLFIAAGIFLAAFVIGGHGLERIFRYLQGAGKMGARAYAWYEGSLAGLQVLRSPRRIAVALMSQGLVCILDLAVCWALFAAFGWQLHFMANVAMLVYLTAALTLPSTPGYIGIYQAAAIFALAPFGVDNSEAAAYGTVLQVITLALFIGSGVWAMRFQKRIAC